MRLASISALLLVIPALAGSSNSLVDVSPDGARMIVANSDNGTVTVVDLKARKALREIAVGDHPEGVAWVGGSNLAIVTLHRDDKVVVVDTAAGKIDGVIVAPAEPYGVVVSRDGKTAYVSHEYPGLVSEIDVAGRKVRRTLEAGEFTRGIALSPDETRVYVTNFYTGSLLAIDLKTGKIADRWPGRASDNLCRHVDLHPTRPKAYLSHLRSLTDIFNARGSIFPELSICTLTPDKGEKRRVAISLDTYNGVYVTANPWESAIRPDGKVFATVYAGTDDMNLSTVIDDDYREIDNPVTLRVGKHPRAVRWSPDGSELYVYATLDYSINVYTAGKGLRMNKAAGIKVCDPPHTPEWVRGKELFVTSQSPMTRSKWISCSSCHPDGFQDGRVWENPEGPRRTPPMWGLAHTHPLHYSADRDEVQDFEYTIRGKLMGGSGLAKGSLKPRTEFTTPAEIDEDLAGRSKDLDALAIYTNSFQPKLSPHIPGPGKLSEEATRGKALFNNATVACATCHSGPYYTDSSLKRPFKLHDVGTGGGPLEKMSPEYDTPTLLAVYRSPPYLHDGRAKTLRDVLTTANPGDRHGKTSHLKPAEIDDLVAFLKSLPYETPPDQTPNTVKDRILLRHKEGQ